jgi:hypothetical protein
LELHLPPAARCSSEGDLRPRLLLWVGRPSGAEQARAPLAY